VRFFFLNLPAHGHINPSLPLVRELTARGHEVTYFATETFRKRIEAVGATLAILDEVGDDYFARHGQDGSTPWEIARIMQETSAQILPDLLKRVAETQPNAILYDCMCPWGWYLAQAARLPAVASYSLIPMTPHMMRDFRILRLSMGAAFWGMGSTFGAMRTASSIADRYGIQKPSTMQLLNVPGDLCIVYSSAEFVPHAETFPPNFRFVGWTLQEPVVAEPFVHESKRPLIYASLGTLINDNFAFFQACIDAFTGSEYDLLISTGGRYKPEEFGAVAANITVREWVPQAQVLRQAALFITHGGVNSIQDGLYNDLPLLLVPQQSEQTINSLAVVDQRAGMMLKRSEVNADSLRTAAVRALSDPIYRQNAVRLGASLRAGGGAARGADEVERLVLGG